MTETNQTSGEMTIHKDEVKRELKLQIVIPQIIKDEAKKFATTAWTYNGIAVTLDDLSLQFATDLTNMVLKQFVLQLAHTQLQASGQYTLPQLTQQPLNSLKTLITEG